MSQQCITAFCFKMFSLCQLVVEAYCDTSMSAKKKLYLSNFYSNPKIQQYKSMSTVFSFLHCEATVT